MRVVPPANPRLPYAQGRIILPNSSEFSSAAILQANHAGAANTAWFSANDPFALPFCLPYGAVVTRLGWLNGSSAGDNADIGIYSSTWDRLVSSGSTACSGNSSIQWVNVTPTALAAGRYFLAFVRDTTTGNRMQSYATVNSVGAVAISGGLESSTDAFPLPNPLTNMALASSVVRIPIIFFSVAS